MTGLPGLEIVLAGETVRLLPERGIYWPARETLIITDTHWGKAATLRANAVPIPRGTTSGDLARLSDALQKTQARKLVILGDVLHARQGRSPVTLSAIHDWRERHAELEILLVRGNHDHAAGDPPAGLQILCLDAPIAEGPFIYRHLPQATPPGYCLAGHIHPAVKLYGRGGQRATLPCFHFSEHVGILPAFGALTGVARVNCGPGDRIFAIAGEEVIEFTGD